MSIPNSPHTISAHGGPAAIVRLRSLHSLLALPSGSQSIPLRYRVLFMLVSHSDLLPLPAHARCISRLSGAANKAVEMTTEAATGAMFALGLAFAGMTKSTKVGMAGQQSNNSPGHHQGTDLLLILA